MNRRTQKTVLLVPLALAAGLQAQAATIGYWRLDDAVVTNGQVIATTGTETNYPALNATGENNARYTNDVPGAFIYDPVAGRSVTNTFALDATAANARIRVPNSVLLDPAAPDESFTVEFFIKIIGEPPAYNLFVGRTEDGPIVDDATTSDRRGWQVDFDHGAGATGFGKIRCRFDTPGTPPPDWNRVARADAVHVDTDSGSGNPADYDDPSDVSNDGDGSNDSPSQVWRHVALTYDDSTKIAAIWSDGRQGTTFTLNGAFVHPGAAIAIGKHYGSNYGLLIDEIRYSSGVLSPGRFLRASSTGVAPTNAVVPPYRTVLGWNALTDDGGDGDWDPHLHPAGTGTVWTLHGVPHRTFAADEDTKGIGAAFLFSKSDAADLNPASPELMPGNPTDFSASLEMWIKPKGLFGGKQVLFSFGGATDGASLLLDDDVLRFTVKDSDVRNNATGSGWEDLVASVETSLSGTGVDDFIQVVGVVEVRGTQESSALYVNGRLATPVDDGGTGLFMDETVQSDRGTNFSQVAGTQGLNPVTFRTMADTGTVAVAVTDWAGAGTGRLGRNGSDIGGHALGAGGLLDLSSYKNKTFQGDVASFNIYPRALTASQVAFLYNQVANTVTVHEVGLATNGLVLSYVADAAYGGATWENLQHLRPKDLMASDALDWKFTHTDNTNLVPDASHYPGISAARQFAAAGDDDDGVLFGETQAGVDKNSLSELLLNLDNDDGPIELWFKPDDLSGKEVLLESGGTGDGFAVRLNDTLLEFAVSNNNNTNITQVQREGLATADLATVSIGDFVQAACVVDMAADELRLYVNGALADTHAGWLGTDWDGGDDAGLGHVAVALGGAQGSGYGDYDGQIAMLRVYDGALTDTQIARNWNVVTTVGGGTLVIVR